MNSCHYDLFFLPGIFKQIVSVKTHYANTDHFCLLSILILIVNWFETNFNHNNVWIFYLSIKIAHLFSCKNTKSWHSCTLTRQQICKFLNDFNWQNSAFHPNFQFACHFFLNKTKDQFSNKCNKVIPVLFEACFAQLAGILACSPNLKFVDTIITGNPVISQSQKTGQFPKQTFGRGRKLWTCFVTFWFIINGRKATTFFKLVIYVCIGFKQWNVLSF